MTNPLPPTRAQALAIWHKHLLLANQIVRDYCYRAELAEEALQESKLALWEACFQWSEEIQHSFEQHAWMVMRRRLFHYLTNKATSRPRLSKREREVMAQVKAMVAAGQMLTCQAVDELSDASGISRYRLSSLIGYWYSSSMAVTARTIESLNEHDAETDPLAPSDQDITLLMSAIEGLTPRQQDIIRSRYLQDPKRTLIDLAQTYGVSIERIRQVEAQAFKKLKATLSERAG